MSERSTTKSSEKGSGKSKATTFQRGEVVRINRSQIVADDVNPRWISKANADRLKKSIKDNGLVGHLVWNRKTGHIVGGHQRLEALDSLMRSSEYDIEVLAVDLSMKDEVKLNVVLNNTDNQGEFDFNALASLSAEFDLDVKEDFGFSDEVVDIQFPAVAEIATENAEDEAPVRMASDEEIAHMKELKKEVREKMKENRQELGDYHSEAKGVLTIVFDRESAKKQWFIDHGLDEENVPSVMHIFEFEKLFKSEEVSNISQ